MEDADFRAGAVDIQWLERKLPAILGAPARREELEAAAIAAAQIAQRDRTGGKVTAPAASQESTQGWARLGRLDGLRER
jgi:hypothetical protein